MEGLGQAELKPWTSVCPLLRPLALKGEVTAVPTRDMGQPTPPSQAL